MKQPDPARGRGDGPDMVSTLRATVAHDEARLELSRRLLRDWLREHPEEEATKPSVYETRGFTEHRLDGSGWRRG